MEKKKKNGRNFQEKNWVGYSPTPYLAIPTLPATPPIHTQPPKSPPQKSPQPLKFQHISILTPNRPKSRTPKLPKAPK